MATKSTINKTNLNIANMDTNYYAEHSLILAQHPSENDLRLMVRILAFIFNANEDLIFCKGIAQDDEPDLWQKNLSGDIELWVDLGQPDEKRIKKACGRSDKVIIYTYQEGMANSWFTQNKKLLNRLKNLSIVYLKIDGDIEELCERSMSLQANISDNELNLIAGENSIFIAEDIWK
ncbi:YaeQ family protein [Sulfurimonas sp.]|uniref:YaeQ family protein n=1 Tax=Sulfurimonas sp. TaxID=2022749 RepID=UPI0025FC8305|nr:YaeQ family protein [Sulfurimonas sp.]MBT5934951.1 YaeQ family protein [Sulfurimonas sp.]